MRNFLMLAMVCMAGSLRLDGAELSLRILDAQDAAVQGAVVEVLGASEAAANPAVSDSQGYARLMRVPPVTVRVQAPGFESLTHTIASLSEAPVALRLTPAILNTTIEVTVTEDPVLENTVESSALVIDRSGARTVYDAVDKLVPSAHVPRRGVLGHGLGSSNSLTLRGLGGSPTTQLLIVVDGRPEVMGLMGHPIPDLYSLTDVGSVAITTGPASVLYGNRAMGGAIEIKPAPAAPGFHTEFTASLGSFYTGQDRLAHGGRIGRLYYRVAGGLEHTNGDRPNSAFRNQDGALHLQYRLTPAWTAAVEGQYGHFHVEDPGTAQAPIAGQWSRVGRGGYSASLQNRSEQAWGSLRFFASHGHHRLHDGFRSVDSNTGFRIVETFAPVSGFDFDAGGDMARYGGRARNILTSLNYGAHHVREGGGFGRARWTPAKNLRLHAGYRYDHNSVFGGVAAMEFGASYRLRDGYSVSLAIGKGFRNPTIRELYMFPAPTPDLRPEHLWNYQATVQLHPVRSLTVWATAYYADVADLIVTTGRYPNLRLQNIGRASNRGLEISARWHILRRMQLASGYAHLSSTNLSPYVPENKLNYSLDIDLSRAFVTLGGRTVGRTWSNTARTARLSGYTTAMLQCTIPAGRHWSVFAMADNLLDRDYQELAGYPMPGINASAGVRVKF